MAKPGNNKKRCEKYKQRGARERNKELKKTRNIKRIEYFKKRREEGKCYIYKKRDNPSGNKPNIGSKQARHTEYSRLRSIFAKLDHEMAMIAAAEKAAMMKATGKPSSDRAKS